MKDKTEQLWLSSVWSVKLFQGQDKLEAREKTKTEIFVPHQTKTQLFVPRTSCRKHQNNISTLKNYIKQKIIQYHKNLFCVVLPCILLFCFVLFYLMFCKPNWFSFFWERHIMIFLFYLERHILIFLFFFERHILIFPFFFLVNKTLLTQRHRRENHATAAQKRKKKKKENAHSPHHISIRVRIRDSHSFV